MEAYANAVETARPVEIGESRTKPGSVAAAIAVYLTSIDFADLAPESKRGRRFLLDRFREEHGDKPIADLRAKHVELMMADKSPYAARNFFKVLRAVAKVGVRTGMLETDPTIGARRPKIKDTGGFKCWTEKEISQFEAHYAIGARRQLAEAGCSANEIAAISGHQSLPLVARYTRAAGQKRMAVAAMAEMNKGATKVANLPLRGVANRPAPKGKKP
jgi:hypothetical protein